MLLVDGTPVASAMIRITSSGPLASTIGAPAVRMTSRSALAARSADSEAICGAISRRSASASDLGPTKFRLMNTTPSGAAPCISSNEVGGPPGLGLRKPMRARQPNIRTSLT